MQVRYERLILKNGGRLDLWISNKRFVASFIRKYKLKPEKDLPVYDDPGLMMNEAAYTNTRAAKSKAMALRPITPWGGIRIPHLHHGVNIYLVDDKQWSNFSKAIIKDFQGRLSNAGSISFDQLMDVSEAVNSIAYK
jgi:hypothetical protein